MVKRKRIEAVVLVAFTVVVLFFSLFGEAFYKRANPGVVVGRVTQATVEHKDYLLIPRTACVDGRVFVLTEREGFDMVHTCVAVKEVQVEEIPEMPDYLHVIAGVTAGELVVSQSDRELADGDVVIVK